MLKDYYEILGVHQTASLDEIKDAYKKLAKAFHPDKHQGDAFFSEKFKSLQEAYAVFTDPVKKQEYDAQWAEFQKSSKKRKGTKQNRTTRPENKTERDTTPSSYSAADLPSLVDIYLEKKDKTLQVRKQYDALLASPKKKVVSWVKVAIAVAIIVLNFLLLNPYFGLLK